MQSYSNIFNLRGYIEMPLLKVRAELKTKKQFLYTQKYPMQIINSYIYYYVKVLKIVKV